MDKKEKTIKIIRDYNIYLMLLICIIICMSVSKNFFTVTNLSNIGRQYAGITVISMGMLLVIMTGGIDLAVGSILALGSVIVAQCLTNYGLHIALAFVLAVLSGMICGAISGFLVSRLKMAPFIVTMAMLTMASGVAFMVSNGSPLKTEKGTLDAMGKATLGPIPVLVMIAVVIVLVFDFILSKTSYGRLIKAVGSNQDTVRLSGIRVENIKLSVYIISGACAAFAGIISASRTGTGTPLYGSGLELDAIAACVIGGANLNGGEGSALKTLVGVIILALIGNIMNLLSVPSYPQDVIKGIIIIAAILLQIATSFKKN